MVIPPKYAVSDVIRKMKQYTASQMRGKFAWLKKAYGKSWLYGLPDILFKLLGWMRNRSLSMRNGNTHPKTQSEALSPFQFSFSREEGGK